MAFADGRLGQPQITVVAATGLAATPRRPQGVAERHAGRRPLAFDGECQPRLHAVRKYAADPGRDRRRHD